MKSYFSSWFSPILIDFQQNKLKISGGEALGEVPFSGANTRQYIALSKAKFIYSKGTLFYMALIKYKAELDQKNYKTRANKVKRKIYLKNIKKISFQISHHRTFPAVVRSRSKSLTEIDRYKRSIC